MLKLSRESTAKQKLGSKKTLLQQYTFNEQQSNALSKHKHSVTKQTNSNTLYRTHEKSRVTYVAPSTQV